jgi:hypothetical protein
MQVWARKPGPGARRRTSQTQRRKKGVPIHTPLCCRNRNFGQDGQDPLIPYLLYAMRTQRLVPSGFEIKPTGGFIAQRLLLVSLNAAGVHVRHDRCYWC